MSFTAAGLEELGLVKWLNGPQARAYVAALRAAFDVEIADLKFAVKQRFVTTCEDEALDDVGGGYVIERFPTEDFVTYRARVRAAWATWRKAGLAVAILDSLHQYGITDVEIYEAQQ